jgi:hypothetical protein
MDSGTNIETLHGDARKQLLTACILAKAGNHCTQVGSSTRYKHGVQLRGTCVTLLGQCLERHQRRQCSWVVLEMPYSILLRRSWSVEESSIAAG